MSDRMFLVSSGGVVIVVTAQSHESACAEAVRQWHESADPPELGLICLVIEVCEDCESYFATEAACKLAGCWAGDRV